jgi:hypothetical protein
VPDFHDPPGRICKLCRHKRPFAEFVWHDKRSDRKGVSRRCAACRSRGRQPDPNLPKLRYRMTRHAVDRYLERVRPEWLLLGNGHGHKFARREMQERMAYAPWEREWPAWVVGWEQHGSEEVGFLRVDEDTIFLLAVRHGDTRVVTVLTRQGSPAASGSAEEQVL